MVERTQKKILRRTIPEQAELFSGLPDFLSRIYLSRGVKSERELDLSLSQLDKPTAMKGLDSALDLLSLAVTSNQKILVVGDFDADGATSTALAVHCLRSMGVDHCSYLVPNRFEFGYGLSPEIVDLAARETPDLIITVDNGISSIEGVDRAKSLGIKVLVTDHHLPGDALPDADAIVNPNQHGCAFSSKNAAGVGVIFYVLSALRAKLRDIDWFQTRGIPDLNMGNYLDLVALGTVADLVPLDRNNRIMVEQGLRRMRAGRCRPGIMAILAVSKRQLSSVQASDMGFAVGPRLNAAGRLDDMSLGIECLLAEDNLRANQLAEQLDQLNRERKSIEDEMKRDAEAYLESLEASEEDSAWGVCLYEPHWHQGVIGILASRVKEKLHRPVIAFAPESDDPTLESPVLKGSARSIPGLHMRDALDLVAKRYPEVLTKFGGHAMAAGMSLPHDKLDEFSRAFDDVVRELLAPSDLEAVLLTDGELEEGALELPAIELLREAGPWGQKFPEPTFDGVFKIVQSRVLKEKHVKLVLMQEGNDSLLDAIQFNSDWVTQKLPENVRVVYRPDINEYRGRRSVQLLLDEIQEA